MAVKLVEAYRAIFNGGNNLKTSERVVLMILCDHLGENGECWPSDERVGEMAALSMRQVKRVRASLIAKGLLRVQTRTRKTNMYTPSLPENEGMGDRLSLTDCHCQSVTDRLSLTDCPEMGDNLSPGRVTICPEMGDTMSPEPLIEPLNEEPPNEPLTLECSEPVPDSKPKKRRKRTKITTDVVLGQGEEEISLPITGKTEDGKPLCCRVCRSQVEEWRGLFPALDVSQELRSMLAWLNANSEKRKTPGGVERFIVNWLSRSQNRGGGSRGSGVSSGNGKAWEEHKDYRYFCDNLHSDMTPPEFRSWLRTERPGEYWERNRAWHGVEPGEYLAWIARHHNADYAECEQFWRPEGVEP